MTDYANAIARMFERNINAAVLVEPVTQKRARALRIVDLYVETIAGYAYGCVAGRFARSVQSWFGAEPAALIRAAAMSHSSTKKPESLDEQLAAPLALRHEAAQKLTSRLGRVVRDLENLVGAAGAILPTDRSRTTEAMFSELNKDSVFDDRIQIEIQTGWKFARAAIEEVPYTPSDLTERARNLWETWSKMAGTPIAQPTREPLTADGYIALVL
ncbi:MAG: hypothetical protein QM831_08460 [Kofleriaceae bacterium]